MAVKCRNCGHFLPDTVIEQKCTEYQVNAVDTLDVGGIVGNFVGNLCGRDKGEDILNRFEYPCPTCTRIHQWVGYKN